jgi:hypothetical protein
MSGSEDNAPLDEILQLSDVPHLLGRRFACKGARSL